MKDQGSVRIYVVNSMWRDILTFDMNISSVHLAPFDSGMVQYSAGFLSLSAGPGPATQRGRHSTRSTLGTARRALRIASTSSGLCFINC